MTVYARTLLVGLLVSPVAQAQEVLDRDSFGSCVSVAGSPQSCVPVLACMSSGDVFFGKAVGWLSGTVQGSTEYGLSCQGTWEITNTSTNYGSAGFECSDGRIGAAEFTYLDQATSSVWGSGTLSDGSTWHVWSGPRLFAYLDRSTELISEICPQATDLLS